MPELEASGDIFTLSGRAEYSEGLVHGRVGGDARISIAAEAELCHGLDAALGAEALAEIQGFLSLLLPALRAQGAAFASAGVQLSAQLAPNLFDKIGFTAQIEAQAQASVAGRIALGLDFETIALLARQQLSGLAYELFIAFLNELVLEAGVWGKASVAAMAGAYLEINGTLADDEDAGFTIAAGADVGWGAGTGWDFYAAARLIDPRRFYATSAQAITDEVVRVAREELPPAYAPAIELLDLLMPTVLLAAFELGQMSALELVRWGTQVDQNAAPFGDAFRLQMQRYVIDKAAEVGQRLLAHVLDKMSGYATVDHLTPAQRDELEDLIEALIADLQAGPLTLLAFGTLLDGIVRVVTLLSPEDAALMREPLAVTWCALALSESIRTFADTAGAAVSVSVVGLGALPAAVYTTHLPAPPELVRAELDAVLAPAPATITAPDAIAYLLAVGLMPLLHEMLPELAALLETLTAALATTADLTPQDLLEAALLGAFGGDLSDSALYQRLRAMMQQAIDDRIAGDLVPALRTALDDSTDALLYLDEVVEPSLLLTSNFVFVSLDRLVAVANRPVPGDEFFNTFRHGLSALAYKVIGRNVIVLSDILLRHTLAALYAGFTDLEADVRRDENHILVRSGTDLLTTTFPHLQAHPEDMEAATRDLITDLLDAGAAAFGPTVWQPARHTELRALLVRLLDAFDTGVDYSDPDAVQVFFRQLAECFYCADPEGMQALATLLGAITADSLAMMLERVVPALQIFWLRLTLPTLDAMETTAHETITTAAELAHQTYAAYQTWLAAFQRYVADLQTATRATGDAIAAAAARLSAPSLHQAILNEIRTRGLEAAADAAAAAPGFDLLPTDAQTAAILTAQTAFLTAFAPVHLLLPGVLSAVAVVGDDLGTLVRDAADLPDLIAAVAVAAQTAVYEAAGAVPGLQAALDAVAELSLADIEAAAHDVVAELGTLRDLLAAALDALEAERAVRQARDAAAAEMEASRQRYETEDAYYRGLLGGPLQIHLLSPHPLAGAAADAWRYPAAVPLYIRVAGARPSFVRPGAPTRILLALNGAPLMLPSDAWTHDQAGDAMVLRYTLTAGTGPRRVLSVGLRDGLNTLECSVVDGQTQRQRATVTFIVDTSLEVRAGELEIAGELMQYDAPGDDHVNTRAEYITLRNAGHRPLELRAWRLRDRVGHTFTFGDVELQPGAILNVRTGDGTDTDRDVHWGRHRAVWNNRGDAVYVIDDQGVLRAEHVY